MADLDYDTRRRIVKATRDLLTASGKRQRDVLMRLRRALAKETTFWGQAEITNHYRISRQQLARWRTERGFPKPLLKIGAGMVWDAAAVIAWYEHRFPDRTTP